MKREATFAHLLLIVLSLALVPSAAIASPAQTFTTLVSFNRSNGADPYLGHLVQGFDGNFYGTTSKGGANGPGTVFKITPSGTLTTIYSFCAQTNCTDGAFPYGGLVLATNGNFYGTTLWGGSSTNTNCSNCCGCGTVFEITASGTLTTLYSFCVQTNCTDGTFPYAGLVQATNGNFYGATLGGGANSSGTVFKITASGTLTTLYSFCAQTDCTDGAFPYAGLVQATNANFYGTTAQGGSSTNCNGGCGTVFKISPSGTLTTLHSFAGTDGSIPEEGVVQATNGNFYGTTAFGGSSDNCFEGCGTVFGLSVGLGSFVETLPTSGKVGAKVIILGNNLSGATSVTFNGTAATFTVVKSTEIVTAVPTGATTGTVIVTTPKKKLKSNVAFRVKL